MVSEAKTMSFRLGKQVRLRCGNTYTVGWMALDKRIKKGAQITLQGKEGVWTVVEVYDTIQDMTKLNRRWPVGGL